jgi:hypothetical protein
LRLERLSRTASDLGFPASTDTLTLRDTSFFYSILLKVGEAALSHRWVQPAGVVEGLQVVEAGRPRRLSCWERQSLANSAFSFETNDFCLALSKAVPVFPIDGVIPTSLDPSTKESAVY